MKLETKYQIEKAVSDDATRLSLLGVYFDKQTAVATDGRIMAIVPCEHTEEEQGKLVQADSLKAIRKAQGSKVSHLEAALNGECKASGKNGETLSFQLNQSTFPNYKGVLPNENNSVKMTIGFDAGLLLELAKAIGAGNPIHKDQFHISMEIRDEHSVIVVKSKQSPEAIGYIMPVRIK